MKKIAVVLAGCGVKDGSEIHESVITLLQLKKHNLDYQCFSLDKKQHHVIDHTKNKPVKNENRNMLTESARIARGEIKKIDEYNPADYDALIFPGGFGVAKNLFTYAIDGLECKIDEKIKKAIIETHRKEKPIGAICISPLLITRAFQDLDITPEVTIGNGEQLMDDVEKIGGKPIPKKVYQIHYDEKNKIVTTPAYTIAKDIAEAASGIEKLVEKIVDLIT
ncbi:MAG: isoprenoid biosynthesis glyoxalase ElbB [Candidatus Thermoplasmatota archaeon]